MDVAYVAQTESCVFLLDGDGICRAAIPNPEADDAARKAAQRCMDAQYVASLDIDVDGVLVSDPKPGRQLLFAKVSPQGKVALIRTAILLEMRSLDGPMPLLDATPVPEVIALENDPDDEEEEESLEFSLDEDEDEKKQTSENPTLNATAPEKAKKDDDDCLELTAPFSREEPKLAALASLVDEIDEQLTRDDFTKIVATGDRESEPEIFIRDSFIKEKAAKEVAPPVERDSSPATVAAPRTVRGFPPPPPIPISSRRGMLPRRA